MPSLTILSNEKIADKTYELILKSDFIHKPGQFINILVPDSHYFIRRPFSIADQVDDQLKIVYKVCGSGTKKLTELRRNAEIDCLLALGNGFSYTNNKKIVLIGGGIGIPPLFFLAKELFKQGIFLQIILGFNTKEEIFYVDEFKQYGQVHVSTVDGSYGIKGTVIDCLKDINVGYFYSVGPKKMLKTIIDKYPIGQVSLEERMGCGFGACMGCSIHTNSGAKRVCKEGPVFHSKELLWND